MKSPNKEFILLRKLTSSDLGWFAEPRDQGLVKSKQRAINFNASIVAKFLSPTLIKSGKVFFNAKCLLPECENEEVRILSKVGKNWRLGGRKVPGGIFLNTREGDLIIFKISLNDEQPYQMTWTVLFQEQNAESYTSICEKYSSYFIDGMTILSSANCDDILLVEMLNPRQSQPAEVTESGETKTNKQRKLTVKERLRQPHLVAEMVKASLNLSAKAQGDFLRVLESVATSVREMLIESGMLQSTSINHKKLWSSVAGRPIAFIDGGSANLATLGAEPIAVRVGSYVVIPGQADETRERFKIEKQLVDELFEVSNLGGVYDDYFEDTSKLRDVARICLEAAGAVSVLDGEPKPHFVFVHGALVNPASIYALEGFPNFNKHAIELMLPQSSGTKTGRDSNFVSVYLNQLQFLRESGVTVCGVVERASQSRLVTEQLLDLLKSEDISPGSGLIEEAKTRLREFRISDAVLFHCILNDGEYLKPIEADRNDLRRAPNEWKDLIFEYPKPMITYVGVGDMSFPLRVEFFDNPPEGFDFPIKLIIHSCKLMPKYAFPAGLDIVDKYAKVPNWMSRPINTTLAVEFLKKAMDSGNSKLIGEAKRMLSGTTRDWLFRPTHTR
jgi:hypothetical protein